MKKILIIGSGEHAKIVIENILDQNIYKPFGMVSFNKKDKNKSYYGCKVVCDYKNLESFLRKQKKEKLFFFIGVGTLKGNMSVRAKIFKDVNKYLKPLNIINPKSHVSKFSKIGKGNLIEAFVKISAGATIGNNCVIESHSSVHHDQKIGNNVFIATNVAFAGSSIGDNSLICDGAVISFKKKIGRNCVVSDGSVVTDNIKSNTFFYSVSNNIKKISIKNFLNLRK